MTLSNADIILSLANFDNKKNFCHWYRSISLRQRAGGVIQGMIRHIRRGKGRAKKLAKSDNHMYA